MTSVPLSASVEAFALSWAEAIVGTSYVSMGRRALVTHLLGLTHQLVEGALAAEFDPSVGRRIGFDMVTAHFTGTETLGRTLALIAERLPALLGCAPPGVDVAGRVAQLTGCMAAGYAHRLRERSLDEQDSIYRAGLWARRQAEQAFAESEAKFRAMFTQAGIGIGIGDLEGNITDANPTLQRMFGHTLEEFAKINVRTMVHSDDTPGAWDAYDELVRGERDLFRVEKRFYRKDGSEIWTKLTVMLVRDECAAPTYQVVLLDDVSEWHRLQAELSIRVAELTATRTAQQLAFEQAREEFRRDLHDGVQQTIAAARIDLDGLAEAETPEEREQAIAQLHVKLLLALDQVHSLQRGVDPPELHSSGR